MLHLIVGNTGSGKTTYAKALKRKTKGILFSIDTWNKTLFLPDKKPEDSLQWFLERIERAESLMLDLVLQLEEAGTDSILDLGFSKAAHREKFREFANANGFAFQLYYLDLPKEVRFKRVQQRNAEKGATFEFKVSKKDFDFMEVWFEEPDEDELIHALHITQ